MLHKFQVCCLYISEPPSITYTLKLPALIPKGVSSRSGMGHTWPFTEGKTIKKQQTLLTAFVNHFTDGLPIQHLYLHISSVQNLHPNSDLWFPPPLASYVRNQQCSAWQGLASLGPLVHLHHREVWRLCLNHPPHCLPTERSQLSESVP